MEIVVSIPNKFVNDSAERLARQLLEAFALEKYRHEMLSLGQLAELLGRSLDEANAFLKQQRVGSNYDFADLEHDRQAIAQLLQKC